MDKVIRKDNCVHRIAGYWTKHVHQLLDYLHAQGVDFVPKPFGFDEQGRERVSFIHGETSDYPLSKNAASTNALTSAAKLLRIYHDASQGFLAQHEALQDWMFPAKNPQEVICHHDFAPYNVVFIGEQAVGIIDFDTAHPGPRTCDIAYALYRFAPFTNPANSDGFGKIDEQILRARLFCQTYGLSRKNRKGLASLMIERLLELVDFMFKSASAGNTQCKLNMQAGHHLKYLQDIAYIRLYRDQIERGLNK